MLKQSILFFVTAQTVFSQQCPSGYNLDTRNNRCFKASTDTQNYVGAMAYCSRDGGLLATMLEFGAGGVWTWVDGTAYAYSNWAPGQSQGGLCAAIQGGTNLWGNPNCSTKLPYICMTDPVPQTIQPTPRHALCETGWTYFSETNSCYRTFTGSRTTHADAEANCVKGSGGHLASIHTSDELYFVSELSATGNAGDGFNRVLVGLPYVSNAWTWTDGTALNYQPWASARPSPGEHYGYLNVDERTDYKGYRFTFDTFAPATTTLRAFVCKKSSLP